VPESAMSPVSLLEVKELLLDALNLSEEYEVDEVGDDASLFGDEGLGLDSLDALQLAVAIEEKWAVTVDEEQGATVFASVRSIADHVNASR
jgi:acyl carrier protein